MKSIHDVNEKCSFPRSALQWDDYFANVLGAD